MISSLFLMSVSAIELEEGVHYDVVTAKKSATKKVSEYFNYGCPGCYKIEPLVAQIKSTLPKDAEFNHVPFENNALWKVYVEAFYIAEMLNMKDKAHEKVFYRVHIDNKQIANKEQLKTLFVELGAEPKRFDQAAKSFQLNSKMRRARKQAISHKVISTPTFVVNDHYRINTRAFSTNEDLIAAINQLINM
jgi:thiol:disulfide interchange protein DsbA